VRADHRDGIFFLSQCGSFTATACVFDLPAVHNAKPLEQVRFFVSSIFSLECTIEISNVIVGSAFDRPKKPLKAQTQAAIGRSDSRSAPASRFCCSVVLFPSWAFPHGSNPYGESERHEIVLSCSVRFEKSVELTYTLSFYPCTISPAGFGRFTEFTPCFSFMHIHDAIVAAQAKLAP